MCPDWGEAKLTAKERVGVESVRRPSVGKTNFQSILPVQCLGTEKITCNSMLKLVTLACMSVHTGLGSQHRVT